MRSRNTCYFSYLALFFGGWLWFSPAFAGSACQQREGEKAEVAISERFSEKDPYANEYDYIIHLPIYRDVLERNVKWVEEIPLDRPQIIDAGGGTGNMVIAAQNARPLSDVFLLDINPAMFGFAREKGISPSRIHESDILDLRINGKKVKSRSIDHVICHSVLWNLKNDLAAIREIHRVLKKGGTAALSTADIFTSKEAQALVDHIEIHLSKVPSVPRESIDIIKERNLEIGNHLVSPRTKEDFLYQLRKLGFEILEYHPAYVVPVDGVPKSLMHHVLVRKL